MFKKYQESVNKPNQSVIKSDYNKYLSKESPFYVEPEFKDNVKEEYKQSGRNQALAEAKEKFLKVIKSQMDLFNSAYKTQRDIDIKQINNDIIEQTKLNSRFDSESYRNNFKFNKPMFSIEQAILDEKSSTEISDNDEAGRIDLVVIFSDGSASIYDHKFIEGKFKSNPQSKLDEDGSVIAEYDRYDKLDHEAIMEKIVKGKMKSWEMQLGRQAEILMNKYGITKIRQVRIKPTFIKLKGKYDKSTGKTDYTNANISVTEVTYSYSGNDLERKNKEEFYKFNKSKVENDNQTKLVFESKLVDVSRFIPMKFERSEDSSLNKFIDNLVSRINKNIRELNKSRSWSTDAEKVNSLIMLQKILADIQLNGKVDSYLSHVYAFIANIKQRLEKDNGTYTGDSDELLSPYNLSFQDIQDAKSEIRFFQDFIKNTKSIFNEMMNEEDENSSQRLDEILKQFGLMNLDMENLVTDLNQKAFNMLLFNAKKKGMREQVFKSFDKFEDIG